MPKVFYTGQSRTTPPAEREWSSDGTGSEAETDVEATFPRPAPSERSSRAKSVHRRSDSMEMGAQQLSAPPKRAKRAGNAIMRQRQSSRELRDSTGQRPLQKACSRGDTERVKSLLAHNNPNLQDRDYAGTTALHTAALQGDDEIVEALLKAGAVPDVRSGPEELDTPLMDAAANGFLKIVKLLIFAGADPRLTNARGRVASDFVDEEDVESKSILAALNERTKELRRQGVAPIDSPTHANAPEGLFPPGFAGIQRPAAPIFLDVSKRSIRQEIIEHAASGDLEYVGAALERGWRPSPDALIKAAKYGHTEVVGLLLAFGLDANTTSNNTTPLRESIQRSHVATAKLLLDSGATLKSEYKQFVTDLPEWDELRALVMGVKVAPKPAQKEPPSRDGGKPLLDESARPRKDSSHREKLSPISEGSASPLEKKDRAPERHRSSLSRTDSFTSLSHKPLEEPKMSSAVPPSRVPTQIAQLPSVGPSSDELESNKKHSEPSISKINLRSIKPKKRSKSVAEGVITSSRDALLPAQPTQQPEIINSNGAAPEPTEHAPAPIENATDESSETNINTHTSPSPPPSSPRILTAPEPSQEPVPPTISAPADPKVKSEPITRHGSTSGRGESPSAELWAERSQELNELAERKAKQRRDREARMLESLVQEQRRRSDSTHESEIKQESATAASTAVSENISSVPSPRTERSRSPSVASIASPGSNESVSVSRPSSATGSKAGTPVPELPPHPSLETQVAPELSAQQQASVNHLPWIVRKLAYTGQPQRVGPLLVHQIGETQYYLDLQVALALGDAQLHRKHASISKVTITPNHKQLLWSFCRPWVSPANAPLDELADDQRKFVDMVLCWMPVNEVNAAVFSDKKPATTRIQLELRPFVRKSLASLPLRWQARASIGGQIW